MKLIDLHCDTMLRITKSDREIGLRENTFHVDIDKLIRANSKAQFFALYVDFERQPNYFEHCLKMLDRFYIEMNKNIERIAFAKNYSEMEEINRKGKMSAFLTIEEGGVLKGELYNLRNFHRLGVRLITLLWNYPNHIGFPNCKEEYMNKGLTAFGREVVCEMNRLNMLIDVSHLSDQGFYDIAQISKMPFIASHSNARAIKNHSRNLTDRMIKLIAEKGGVMGINFCAGFLGNTTISRMEDKVEHIKHIKNIGGIDVIAIGSDYDGIDCELEIKNIGEMNKLAAELEKNGFSLDEIERIFFKNAERVIKDVLQ
ncbi:MAG: dipeptidase [Alkaliphilus sp.]